ncbi:MAG: hypothetical protein LQ343_003206 [Gyalolechia ehrenbergii]|nr:MAG: hypothetical protein LQ343_003206 [Gyalolechia ehrenbergii]
MASKTPPTPSSPHTPTTPAFAVSSAGLINPSTSASTNLSVQFRRKLTHLATPLAPLLSITSGTTHPSFPSTILNYHLLTEEQLNDLAHHYHQRTPNQWSLCYPLPIVGRWHAGSGPTISQQGQVHGEANLEDKRRRFGRFMGLRGCESPVDGDGEEGREREQRAMELWVAGEMRRREERAWAEMTGRGKGFW